MFCVIYRFAVKPGREKRFVDAWSEVTRAFMHSCNALGSRLHTADGQEYIAYAQWPSRQTRESAELPETIKEGAWVTMRECCDWIEALYELTPVADHLVPASID